MIKYIKDFPTVAMFFSFFVMSCAFAYFTPVLKIAFFAVLVLSLLAVVFIIRSRFSVNMRRGLILVLSAVIIADAVSFCAFDLYADRFDSYDGVTENVELKIYKCDYTLSYASSYRAEVVSSPDLKKGTKVILNTPLWYMENGTILSGEVQYTSLDKYLGSFNAKNYYNSQKIMLVCDDVSLAKTGFRKTFSLTTLFDGINENLTAKIMAHTKSDAGGLLSAVLLGNRDHVTDAETRDFRRMGVSHLLVVSGTHFAVVVTMCEFALRKLKLSRRVRSFINIAVILMFMALTGFSPSVVRAGIMQLLSQISILVSRKVNMINSFSMSGSLLILLNPLCAVDCGLQLSFAATYSCIVYQQLGHGVTKRLRRKITNKKIRKASLGLAETLLMTCYVNLNMLPLTWLYFGEVSLLSILANLIFIPLITVLIYLGGVYLLLYPLRIFIVPTASLVNLLCGIITKISDFFASLRGVMLPINYSFSIFFLIPMTVMLLSLPYCEKKNRKKLFTATAAVIVAFFSVVGIVRASDRNSTYITYIGEGVNDGFVLKSGGKTLLCEISNAAYGYMYNLTDEMENLHSCEIDAVFLTHYHQKHLQLLGRLCEREIVHELILTTPVRESEEAVFDSIIALADEHGIAVSVYGCGEAVEFYGSEVTLLDRKYLSRSTHPITAVKISSGGEDAVITSCSFNEANESVMDAVESAEYVVLGRHSPKYKKTFGLTFDEVPKAMVISSDAYSNMDEGTVQFIDELGESAVIDGEILRIKIS